MTTKKAVSFDETAGNRRSICLKKTSIRTLPALIAKCKIDTAVWVCKRFRVNKWEMAAIPRAVGSRKKGWRRPSTKVVVTPLFQVRADFERRPAVEATKHEINLLRKEAAKFSPVFPRIAPRIISRHSGNVAEFSIYDHHFGALIWGKETGWEDYDMKIAREVWERAVVDLIRKAGSWKPERAMLVLGNDQQNADNRQGTTEAGTQQNMDSRYQKVFLESRRASQWAIDALLGEFGAVDVVIVPGNHDPVSAWHLGDSLAAWYRRCRQVRVDNLPTLRKYYEHGVNMLMLTHGNKGKLEKYPMVMAAEQPAMWGRTKWREAHTGDKHHRHEIELPGATVRILPSLRPSCTWGSENMFVGSIRAAEVDVWNVAEGMVGRAFHSVLPAPRAKMLAA